VTSSYEVVLCSLWFPVILSLMDNCSPDVLLV